MYQYNIAYAYHSLLFIWNLHFYLSGNLQFGFRANHSTQDAIFVLSSLIQTCKSSHSPYHVLFIDITKVSPLLCCQNLTKLCSKAYDSVFREGLYLKLQNLGFGGRVLSIIRSMYHVRYSVAPYCHTFKYSIILRMIVWDFWC